MAYVSKNDKAKIVAAVKAVLPKNWKATFAVDNYSTIVMTIKSTPLLISEIFTEDFLAKRKEGARLEENGELTYLEIHWNENYKNHIKAPEYAEIFEKINDALNLDNYNNSDIMSDYHDVGHYVSLSLGKYNKPYIAKA